jgi:hypothetical protein
MTGIIYFIQPAELVGTNRFKVGRSDSPTLDRCKKGYKVGTRYLCVMECDDQKNIEDAIKKLFKEKYKLVAGLEYFEGDANDMLLNFIKIVLEMNTINICSESTESLSVSSSSDVDDSISEMFPDYKTDVVFGGTKQLIKISKSLLAGGIIVHYISNTKELDDFDSERNMPESLLLFNKKLLKAKIIKYDKTYDMLDYKFTQKLDQYKPWRVARLSTKTAQRFEDYKNVFSDDTKNSTYNNIMKYLFNNCRINDAYVSEMSDNIYLMDEFHTQNMERRYNTEHICFCEYRELMLENNFLLEGLPYVIEYVSDNKFYIINRNYEYIGLNTKQPPHNDTNPKRIYIKNWDYRKIGNISKQYNMLTHRRECMNPSIVVHILF